jgi:hypothetical protein
MSINLELDLKACNHASRQINATYLKNRIYVACDDLNFDWLHRDINTFRHMWSEGFSVDDIAKAFKRPVDEVAILVLDQARKGDIQIRSGGANGNRRPGA